MKEKTNQCYIEFKCTQNNEQCKYCDSFRNEIKCIWYSHGNCNNAIAINDALKQYKIMEENESNTRV